jgi:hypothetical protein
MKSFYSLHILFLSLITSFSFAQTSNQKPCSAPEASQFDFWIGDWNLTWSDSLHGSNRVEKLFGNCTVHENFSDPRLNYLGQSWSVYNPTTKIWQQTWIDNMGGYIDLTGGMRGDSMVLTTAEKNVPVKFSPSGKLISRMVFYNIKSDSFDWSWEASTDSGESWKPNWKIHYLRK